MQNKIGCIHFVVVFFNCNIHYKDVVKHSSVGQKKSSYVLLALAPLCSYSEISTCAWPQSFGLGLGLGLAAFWPRLTSLVIS